MPVLLFIVNVDWFFVSHRLPIAIAAQRCGYQVHVATGLTDRRAELEAHGFTVHALSIERGGSNVFKVWREVLEIWRVMRAVRPDIVHLITIKPILLGGLAARAAAVRTVVAAVSGLGYAFVASGAFAALRRSVIGLLYRFVLGPGNVTVIFQNPDDRRRLSAIARLPPEKTVMIHGSGVDLTRFAPQPLPEGIPVVVLAARLLADKGVREFVRAADMLKRIGCEARFVLVGQVDPGNLASLRQDELDAWVRDGTVECWGQRTDMPQVLAQARLVVLPSYREGMPKVLLEAAACARAVVTTDVPGCRDAIVPGVTGVLVPVRNASALADAMSTMLLDAQRCQAMGAAGRALAERTFDLRDIVAAHLQVYAQAVAPEPAVAARP